MTSRRPSDSSPRKTSTVARPLGEPEQHADYALRERIARTGHDYVHTHYPFDRMAWNMLDVLFHDGQPMPLTDPGSSLQRGAIDPETMVPALSDLTLRRGIAAQWAYRGRTGSRYREGRGSA